MYRKVSFLNLNSERLAKPMDTLQPLTELPAVLVETTAILKKVASASRQLAELKGVVAAVPNPEILMPDPIETPELSAKDRLITREETEALPSAIDPANPPTAAVDPKPVPKQGTGTDPKTGSVGYTA